MNNFNYEYPVRQHFGKGCAESAIKEEMKRVGQRVLLAYGGGSLKRTGLYDKIRTWLAECGKQVTDFCGIMPNPTYAKVQEGARLARENRIEFIFAVGAYTDRNHGQGLAVIHPTLYRHLLEEGKEKLARMAENVWGVTGKTTEETAARGIDALEAFIKEIGLPTRWSEMGITDETVLRAAADTCFLTPGCCKPFAREEIFEVLRECM